MFVHSNIQRSLEVLQQPLNRRKQKNKINVKEKDNYSIIKYKVVCMTVMENMYNRLF